MVEFQIQPHIGVGPVRLGASREQVHAALGNPASAQGNREMFLDGFFVDYDDSGMVEFIQLARSSRFRGVFHGVCLHEVSAEQALEAVSHVDSYDLTDPELGYSYIFLDLQLSLWRGTRPEPEQPSTDPDGRHFEAVGVAINGYFQPRCKI